MSRLIKNLKNNRKVIFDRGNFDEWCVYVVEKNGIRHAPFDKTYFSDLQRLSGKYPKEKIYNDFVQIYENTSQTIDSNVCQLIDKLVESYDDTDKILIEQWFAVLYAGMIAEENKQGAILKKRIKRLGMYQILVLNEEPEYAANFSKGKKWRDLDILMKKFGF